MRIRASPVIISVMAVVIAVLLWAVIYFARDEWHLKTDARDNDLPVRSHVGTENGFATVRVTEQGQQASGIVTQEIEESSARAAVEIYGTVVNIQPLLDLRTRYVAAISEARALRAAAANSEAEYRRVKKLFEQDRNVSERAVQAAQAQWDADQAHLAGADQAISAAHASIRVAFGEALAKWATNPESAAFEALAQQREALVQLVFPFDMQAQAGKPGLTIAPASIEAPGRTARYVSPAPQGDSALPGATYFYIASGIGGKPTGLAELGVQRDQEGGLVTRLGEEELDQLNTVRMRAADRRREDLGPGTAGQAGGLSVEEAELVDLQAAQLGTGLGPVEAPDREYFGPAPGDAIVVLDCLEAARRNAPGRLIWVWPGTTLPAFGGTPPAPLGE